MTIRFPPALEWDGQNSAREKGEEKLSVISSQLSVAQGKLAAVRSRLADAKKALTAAEVKALTDDCKLTTENLRHAEDATRTLKAMSKPFLNWAGKAERLSFDVPTLPLFVHERLSTKAIIETLTSHKRDKQIDMFSLFGDPQHSFTDQVLRAYEHRDKWVNRMVLGDSLVVMNSLLHYEGLGGQVQMIYMDPPYGVKFGSNFQPFVRNRDVAHGDDEDMTREPEMVQAYRDTWELGLHSYITYLRDRFLLARELLSSTGSFFVQISDENLHHLRELLDEVFGNDNFCSIISVKKTSGLGATLLQTTQDFLLWYAKDRTRVKYHQLYSDKADSADEDSHYTADESGRVYTLSDLTAQNNNVQSCLYVFQFEGSEFHLPKGRQWKTTEEGMQRLVQAGRVVSSGNSIRYKRYLDDFPLSLVTDTWHDIGGSVQSRSDPKIYVVQTGTVVVQRCLLMTTDPGDLVLDPTCGSGTTAYCAEMWGRRWITMDTSRVPLALARQRLLTATFPWYELKDEARGPGAGFVYQQKQNRKGESVGGIVSHVTLESFARNEPPEEEVLVDRPESDNKITRVTGAFCVEGTIPTPVELEAVGTIGDSEISNLRKEAIGDSKISDLRADLREGREAQSTFTDRMLEILRKSPLLRLEGNRTLALKNIRPPAKTLSLSAEALVDATAPGQTPTLQDAIQEAAEKNGKALALSAKPVALVFGPENGAISERLVQEAAKEAALKNYTHLYVIGFAIQPNARQLIENCDAVVGIPATYIQATPDLLMGDLLKNMRSSQIFSVCGLPEIKVRPAVAPVSSPATGGGDTAATGAGAGRAEISDLGFQNRTYQVELLGLDVFDPITMETHHGSGSDVPAWFLDTDYNGLCFHVSQAFFPRTSAWDNLKKALKSEFEESVWDHLSGTTSAPFEAGENRQIAVKVIDDRGNELMVVEKLR